VLKQYKRRPFRISGKADQYLNDLNAEIEMGWTGPGQTNRLLGRITMRSYVFHHVLTGGQPLTGQALVEEIVRVARSLPGYADWCRHQHELEHRAEEWARCIENSHYFHYGEVCGKYKAPIKESIVENLPNWNQQQSESAREKIRSAIADLLEKGLLPSSATQRFKVLLGYRIGGGSLYRHKDLWHPQYLRTDDELDSISEEKSPDNAPRIEPSLLCGNGSNDLSSDGFSDSEGVAQCSTDVARSIEVNESSMGSRLLSIDVETWQAVTEEAFRMTQQQPSTKLPSSQQLSRMQRFLASGDPILMAEAKAWFQRVSCSSHAAHLG
jgi:hypothetical protein